MKRRVAIPALIALVALAGVATSQAEFVQVGNLRVRFDAGFTPHALPRRQPAPVEVQIHGAIATTDGSHPPPLRRLEVELNRNGRLEAKGLPICAAPQLQSTSTTQALERCRGALVGRGRFRAVVALGGEIPAEGKIFAFNSRRHGKPALLLHFFAGAPVQLAMIVPLTITLEDKGNFGTVLSARIPRLGGGAGSVTEIDLSIGRRYSFGGKRRSYVSAACNAPPDFTEIPFPFARAGFHFEAHKAIRETLLRSCRVRG